jgi:hypothetical protein
MSHMPGSPMLPILAPGLQDNFSTTSTLKISEPATTSAEIKNRPLTFSPSTTGRDGFHTDPL